MNTGSDTMDSCGTATMISRSKAENELQPAAVSPQPLQLNPFDRDPHFIRRGDDVLEKIIRCCSEPAGRVALFGPGGVGKSHLAGEFAHRIAKEHSDRWLFWIQAGTQARVEEGFRTIADTIKLADLTQPMANVPLLVKNWLSDLKNGRWTLVIDGVGDNEVLYAANEYGHEQLPLEAYLPQSQNGSIIITTRSREVALKLAGDVEHIIGLEPMTKTDAIELLKKKLESTFDTDMVNMAEDLVQRLGYLLLAISQAAAYIRATPSRKSIQMYLAELRSIDIMQWYELEPRAVLKTWQISVDYIRRQRPSAANLLSSMSLFDRQGIPKWVLESTPREMYTAVKGESMVEDKCALIEVIHYDKGYSADDEFEEDIQMLRKYCLVVMNRTGDKLEVPGLVQLSTQNWLEDCKLQETYAEHHTKQMAALLQAKHPTKYSDGQTRYRDLFVHIQATLNYKLDWTAQKAWATLCYLGGEYALSQGRYDIAQRMVNKSVEVYEKRLGKDDDLTWQSRALAVRVMLKKAEL